MIVLEEAERARDAGTIEMGPFNLAAGESHIGIFLTSTSWPEAGAPLLRVTMLLSEAWDDWSGHIVETNAANPETGQWHLVYDLGFAGADPAEPMRQLPRFTGEHHRLRARIDVLRPFAFALKIATDRLR